MFVVLGITGEVVPFVGVFFEVVQFFAFLSVFDVAPVAIHDCELAGIHVRQVNIAVLCG